LIGGRISLLNAPGRGRRSPASEKKGKKLAYIKREKRSAEMIKRIFLIVFVPLLLLTLALGSAQAGLKDRFSPIELNELTDGDGNKADTADLQSTLTDREVRLGITEFLVEYYTNYWDHLKPSTEAMTITRYRNANWIRMRHTEASPIEVSMRVPAWYQKNGEWLVWAIAVDNSSGNPQLSYQYRVKRAGEVLTDWITYNPLTVTARGLGSPQYVTLTSSCPGYTGFRAGDVVQLRIWRYSGTSTSTIYLGEVTFRGDR
jgi:hypothetical protein